MFDAQKIYDEALAKNESALESVVFQALGAASVCWDDDRVFMNAEAKQIGDSLVALLRQLGVEKKSRDYAEVYRDESGEYRYRVFAGNHEQIGKSEEGYTTRSNAYRALRRTRPDIQASTISDGKIER